MPFDHPTLTGAAGKAVGDAIAAVIGSGGRLRIYSGTPPEDVNAPLADNALLADRELADHVVDGDIVGAAQVMTVLPESVTVTRDATFFRMTKADGTAVIQGLFEWPVR